MNTQKLNFRELSYNETISIQGGTNGVWDGDDGEGCIKNPLEEILKNPF